MACHDIRVSLATEQGIPIYDVYLGAYDNTMSYIVVSYTTTNVSYHEESGLLDCDEYRSFWISWRDNEVNVGKGEIVSLNNIMNFKADRMIVNHLSFGSFSIAEWQFDEELG